MSVLLPKEFQPLHCHDVAPCSLPRERGIMGSTTPGYHTALSPRRAQSQPGDGEDVKAAWIQGNASLAPNLMVLFAYQKSVSRCTKPR